MNFHLIQFTAGRVGVGYLELPSDLGAQPRLLDAGGQPIPERVVEYHVVDADPPRLPWMVPAI